MRAEYLKAIREQMRAQDRELDKLRSHVRFLELTVARVENFNKGFLAG